MITHINHGDIIDKEFHEIFNNYKPGNNIVEKLKELKDFKANNNQTFENIDTIINFHNSNEDKIQKCFNPKFVNDGLHGNSHMVNLTPTYIDCILQNVTNKDEYIKNVGSLKTDTHFSEFIKKLEEYNGLISTMTLNTPILQYFKPKQMEDIRNLKNYKSYVQEYINSLTSLQSFITQFPINSGGKKIKSKKNHVNKRKKQTKRIAKTNVTKRQSKLMVAQALKATRRSR